MIIKESTVSSRKPPVETTCRHPVYETLQEALSDPNYGLGEEKILDLLNAQVKTNAMNEARMALTKGPSKSHLRSLAWSEVAEEIASGQHRECLGNQLALDALVDNRMKVIAERMKAAAATGASGEADEDDGESDDSGDESDDS